MVSDTTGPEVGGRDDFLAMLTGGARWKGGWERTNSTKPTLDMAESLKQHGLSDLDLDSCLVSDHCKKKDV